MDSLEVSGDMINHINLKISNGEAKESSADPNVTAEE